MLSTGTFLHCYWLPTQAGKGIHLTPWEKRFLLMQLNIYVFSAVVCVTTASESNFLEVRTAVLSITKGTRPVRAAGTEGVSSSPCTSLIS